MGEQRAANDIIIGGQSNNSMEKHAMKKSSWFHQNGVGRKFDDASLLGHTVSSRAATSQDEPVETRL